MGGGGSGHLACAQPSCWTVAGCALPRFQHLLYHARREGASRQTHPSCVGPQVADKWPRHTEQCMHRTGGQGGVLGAAQGAISTGHCLASISESLRKQPHYPVPQDQWPHTDGQITSLRETQKTFPGSCAVVLQSQVTCKEQRGPVLPPHTVAFAGSQPQSITGPKNGLGLGDQGSSQSMRSPAIARTAKPIHAWIQLPELRPQSWKGELGRAEPEDPFIL